MYVTSNGVRLAYYQRGRGRDPVLLLVHGFPLDHRLWQAQLSGLASQAWVIAPDLRGFGRSELGTAPLAMEQHADDMAALLDRLGVARAVVAGLSMGGYIAFAFWRRHPDRVRSLVLADTRAEPDSVVARAGRDAAAQRVQEVGAATFAEEMLPKLLAPANLSAPRIAAAARAMMAAQSVPGIVAALAGLRDREDNRPTLPTISVPTLVLVGEEDTLTPPSDAAAMAGAIPGARLVTIPKAGHLSPLENPRAVNAALREFLRQV